MKGKTFPRQFAQDGLTGLIVLLIASTILAAIFSLSGGHLQLITYDFDLKDILFSLSQIGFYVNPIPIVLVSVFISCGVCGHYLENVSSRISWYKPTVIIVITTMFSTLVLFVGILIIFIQISGEPWNKALFLDILALEAIIGQIGLLGAAIGFLLGFLLRLILNPVKRNHRIVVGAITSSTAGIVFGLGTLLFQVFASG